MDGFIRASDLDSLEAVLLSGRGDLLKDKTAWSFDVKKFLQGVPKYQVNG